MYHVTNSMNSIVRKIFHNFSVSFYSLYDLHKCNNIFFLEFLEELNSVRLASISEVPAGQNCNPPVLLHCVNGERSGLTLVADLLLYTLDHNQVSKWNRVQIFDLIVKQK